MDKKRIRNHRHRRCHSGRARLSPVPHLEDLRLGHVLRLQTHQINKLHPGPRRPAHLPCVYVLRAVRWKIFLRPVRPDVSPVATGRLRPSSDSPASPSSAVPANSFAPISSPAAPILPVSSQFAVWAVERIFDIGAFTVLLVISIFLPSAMPSIPNGPNTSRAFGRQASAHRRRHVMAILAWHRRASRRGHRQLVRKTLFPLGRHLEPACRPAHPRVRRRTQYHSRPLLASCNSSLCSLGMWSVIALAYQEVTHSYGVESLDITQTRRFSF